MRTESDTLGNRTIPADDLRGIHTHRALDNFRIARRPIDKGLIHAYGWVKLACAEANHEIQPWSREIYTAIRQACREVSEGLQDNNIMIDALQGGAGTSTNMCLNEVIANRALQILGKNPGEYQIISPHADINRHQSTNDTFPTALRLAAITALRDLEREVVSLQEAFQEKERAWDAIVKVGRTEMQDAVLTTLGRSMSAYAEVLSRDRWRIYKCEERLRVINLGGTAIGTGLGAPRCYIFSVSEKLKSLTGIGFARAENLIDATQNTDAFVEVSGFLKTLAATLLKIANDLRFLASGPEAGIGELQLPALQAGSSIMPGKINPVIPEAVAQASITVVGQDQILTSACAAGHLELNPYMPLIADSLLTSISLLTSACLHLRVHCIKELKANEARCQKQVSSSTATITALVPYVGYAQATVLYQTAHARGLALRDHVIQSGALTANEFDAAVSSGTVMRLGHPAPKDT